MKTLSNINIDYPSEQEINSSINNIYNKLNQKKHNKQTFKYIRRFSYVFASLIFIYASFLFLQSMIYQSSNRDIIYLTEQENLTRSNNVFIGQITKFEGTKHFIGGGGYPVPYTYYEVKPLYDFKGNTSNYEHVIYYGGKSIFGGSIEIEDAPALPKIGDVYLFLGDPVKDSDDYREKDGYFSIRTYYNEKSLSGYDTSKSPFDQNETITNYLNKIMYYVDHPVSAYLSDFLKYHQLENEMQPEEFNYLDNEIDIRLYYIEGKYYLYYLNDSLNSVSLSFTDVFGDRQSIIIDKNQEYIEEITLDESHSTTNLYLNQSVIGEIAVKDQFTQTGLNGILQEMTQTYNTQQSGSRLIIPLDNVEIGTRY